MTTSQVLASQGVEWIDRGDKTWQVKDSNNTYQVTFYPEVFAEDSSLRFMNFGDPLFEEFLTRIIVRKLN
ncbi:hypothetical protein [Euhalothece natronophila]|uniref:hypothetical protein n=1 Tax=Euhalothece natronophila TaxID=577489 RepID=UPI0036F33B9B